MTGCSAGVSPRLAAIIASPRQPAVQLINVSFIVREQYFVERGQIDSRIHWMLWTEQHGLGTKS